MSISRTVPALPKSIVTVARAPDPVGGDHGAQAVLVVVDPVADVEADGGRERALGHAPVAAVGGRGAPPEAEAADRGRALGLGAPPVDQLGGDLVEEPGRRVGVGLPERRPDHRPGQVQPLLRARDADVREPPLLGQLGGVGQRTHVREHAVLPAGEEHDRELQALRGVQGHQRDHARSRCPGSSRRRRPAPRAPGTRRANPARARPRRPRRPAPPAPRRRDPPRPPRRRRRTRAPP